MKYQLILPMALYVFYIWVLAVFNFITRYRAIKCGELSQKYFQTYLGETPSDHTQVVGRHYDHQFQLPILFFITCVLNIALDSATVFTLVLAWLFVVSRFFHSWVHLGSNIIRVRVFAFAMGWLMVGLMWIQLTCFALR